MYLSLSLYIYIYIHIHTHIHTIYIYIYIISLSLYIYIYIYMYIYIDCTALVSVPGQCAYLHVAHRNFWTPRPRGILFGSGRMIKQQ